MRNFIKKMTVLVTAFCLSLTVCFRPVRTDAVVGEIVAGVTLYEAVETLVLSLGCSYLVYEGAEQAGVIDGVKESFSDYVFGTGAEKWKEVEQSQIELYRDNTNGGSGDDPEKEPSDDDKLSNIASLAVNSTLVNYIYDFYNDYFGNNAESVLDPDYVAKSFIKYSDAPGLLNRLCFGAGPYFSSLESYFQKSDYAFLDGSAVWRIASASSPYDYVMRYINKNWSDICPVLYLESYSGTNTDCSIYITANWTDGFCGLAEGELTNSDGSKNKYPEFRPYNYKYNDDVIASVSSAWAEKKLITNSFDVAYTNIDDLIYWNIPDSLIIDKKAGLTYYYDSSGLRRRQYDAFGDWVEESVDGGYIYNIDGTYQSLKDVYPDTDSDDFILQRLNELQNYIQTNYPEEVPYINYSEMEALQPQIQEAQNNVIQEYPMSQPNTQEVPSTYPQEVDNLIQNAVNNSTQNNPSSDPDVDPDADPDSDTDSDSDSDSEKEPDSDSKPSVSSNKGDYALSLGDFFPFCIPRDLYWVIEGLDATPKAPKFTIPFPYVGENGMNTKDVTIDLSDFDGVAKAVRVVERILFIAGLLFVSRKLVKGG